MRHLDYCRVMEKIAARPSNPVDITFAELTLLKEHLKECHKCSAIAEAISRMDKPRIGPKPSKN